MNKAKKEETSERKTLEDKKIVAYLLKKKSHRAERLLLSGERDEGTYYDGTPDIEEGSFRYNDTEYDLPEKSLNVDKQRSLLNPKERFLVFYNSGKKNPIAYEAPGKWTARDLKVIRREQTTAKGVEGLIPESGSGTGRGKVIFIFIVLFGITLFVLFVLPSIFPVLKSLPLF